MVQCDQVSRNRSHQCSPCEDLLSSRSEPCAQQALAASCSYVFNHLRPPVPLGNGCHCTANPNMTRHTMEEEDCSVSHLLGKVAPCCTFLTQYSSTFLKLLPADASCLQFLSLSVGDCWWLKLEPPDWIPQLFGRNCTNNGECAPFYTFIGDRVWCGSPTKEVHGGLRFIVSPSIMDTKV
eukprot:GHVQ01041251.1.p2 GENE.GHVQ01041251.1~~GHVQ01041251.1.p2  ORF type:complete len:180 (-),score=14.82 GHVQ01041251.1:1085-1624(-)